MSNLDVSRAERLDQYVVRQFQTFPEMSRATASKLIEEGKVTVGGEAVLKPGYKLRKGDDIIIAYDHAAAKVIPEIELEILYEDTDCVVINKPVGVLTHSKGQFNPEGTVGSWLRGRLAADLLETEEERSNQRAGIVHRLDRATSGVMICAKNKSSLSWLQKQFAQRRTKKTYNAVICGQLKVPAAVIDMPIERNPKKPQTFRVGVAGKPSVTEYQTLETANEHSLLELKPTTGRTHQLRVHLSHLGHPIVGDVFYGGEPADRLYLHAASLEITLPNRERTVFSVPMPESFNELIQHG
jgi:23S rRNA pseudouridine1911/1915/1917 synthase